MEIFFGGDVTSTRPEVIRDRGTTGPLTLSTFRSALSALSRDDDEDQGTEGAARPAAETAL